MGHYIHAGNKCHYRWPSAHVEGAGAKTPPCSAAMNPIALNEEGVDASVVEKEIEIAKDQLRQEGNQRKC